MDCKSIKKTKKFKGRSAYFPLVAFYLKSYSLHAFYLKSKKSDLLRSLFLKEQQERKSEFPILGYTLQYR